MKILHTIFFFFFFLLLNHHVCSQTTDSCNSNINFNDIVNFDTTAMLCQSVWKAEGYFLRYAKAGTDLWSFLLSAPDTSSWIGIGFSTNGMMIGSSAMVGWMYQNGTGVARKYYLNEQDTNQVLVDQGNLTVVNNTMTVFTQSKLIYMAFQLNTPQPLMDVLYAVGPYNRFPTDSGGLKLTQHRDQVSTSLNYATGSSQSQSSPYTGLRRTHGALNMVGWGILMPMGVIAARYFKEWDPVWFYTHAAIQFFGWLFGLVGFILGFVTEGFLNAKVGNHKNLGITILVLGCLQVTALLVRPQKGSKVRKYWNWYHQNAGRIMIILAISNIFYGIRLGMEGASWYGTYAVILAILFVAAVVLEIRLWRKS